MFIDSVSDVTHDKLIISKVNDTYITIDGARGTLQEVKEYFKFRVPGYQFSPKFRAGIWDGWFRLYNIRNRQIYYGLLPRVLQFAKDRGYQVETRVEHADPISLQEFGEFIKRLNLPDEIELRPYQLKSLLRLLRDRRGALLSPTRSGKTLIQYLISQWYGDKKFLFIVPNVGLLDQMYENFIEYGADPNSIHRIAAGEDKQSDKRLVISTWQSIHNLPTKYFAQYQVVVGDECHMFDAKCIGGTLEKCVNARYRFGLTGSLSGRKIHQLVIEGLFGRVHKLITTKELIDQEYLTPLRVKVLTLHYKPTPKMAYRDELNYIAAHKERQQFITRLVSSLPGNVLTLFRYLNHGKQILRDLENAEHENKQLYYVAGETTREERSKVRRELATVKDSATIASYRTFSEGMTLPLLNNLVLAHPTKARIRLLQSIGRVLTPHEDKQHATLYDIVDDLGPQCYGNKHFQERLKLYQQEKFDVQFYDIQLEK